MKSRLKRTTQTSYLQRSFFALAMLFVLVSTGVAKQATMKILFVSNREDGLAVYVMNADGSHLTNLTNYMGRDYNPAWSPDGSKIAFISLPDIYVMDVDGSNAMSLTNPGLFSKNFAWSPDGTKIAFSTSSDEIYVMNADGSSRRQLTGSVGSVKLWSPDGTTIVLSSEYGVSVVDADGTTLARLVSQWKPATLRTLVWSPDGTKIAFIVSLGETYGGDLYVRDETKTIKLTTPVVKALPSTLSWSPDGREIAFVSKSDGNTEIYVVGINGSPPLNLTRHSGMDDSPVWSPDGTKIAFVSDRDGNYEIYVMNPNGSNPINLTNDPARDDSLCWSPLPRALPKAILPPYKLRTAEVNPEEPSLLAELINELKGPKMDSSQVYRLEKIVEGATSLPFLQATVEPLIIALKDPNTYVRSTAISTLRVVAGKVEDTTFLQPAVAPLTIALKDSDPRISSFASYALEAISAKSTGATSLQPSVESLINALKNQNEAVRESAHAMLIKIGNPAVEPLIATLADEKADVHISTASALVEIGDQRGVDAAVPVLIADLKHREASIRVNAASLLVQIGARNAIEAALPVLIEGLKHKEQQVSAQAAFALSQSGELAVEPLIPVLKVRDAAVRIYAIQLLVAIGDRRGIDAAITAIIVMLKDRNAFVRLMVINTLSQITSVDYEPNPQPEGTLLIAVRKDITFLQPVVEPLITTLNDPAELVTLAATATLLRIAENADATLLQPAVGPLIVALKDKKASVRRNAASVLSAVVKNAANQAFIQPAIAPLIAAFNDQDIRGIHELIAEALAEVGAPVIASLITDLKHPEAGSRRNAAVALEQIAKNAKDKTFLQPAVHPLKAALEDPDAAVRSSADKALERLKIKPRTLSVEETELINQLKHPDPEVLRRAVYRLRGIVQAAHDPSFLQPAIEPMIAALKGQDDSGWRNIAHTLGMFGELAVQPLITALTDSDADIRRGAVHALLTMAVNNADTTFLKPAVEPLIVALEEMSPEVRVDVRAGAAWALGSIAERSAELSFPQSAVEPLIAVLNEQGDASALKGAAVVLERIAEQAEDKTFLRPAVEPLIAKLMDVRPLVPTHAAFALIKIGYPDDVEVALPVLIAALNDWDVAIRVKAAATLVNLGDKAIPELERAAKADLNPAVREAADKVLKSIRNRE
jgi:Tol biopolymer transport system component/HEAT repeat protein